jgi:hypothetical protein
MPSTPKDLECGDILSAVRCSVALSSAQSAVVCAVFSALGSSAEDSGRYSHHSLRSIDSRDLTRIRPFFGATNESSAHRILEHILPLSGVAFIAAQKMIVKARLPEGTKLLTVSLRRFASDREQNTIEFTFQSLDPRTQSRSTSNPKTGKQMNVIGHENITPHPNAKVSCAPAVLHEGFVHQRTGK